MPTGACDFIADFALRYPTEVFLALLGLPVADADLLVPCVGAFFGGFSGDPTSSGMADALTDIRSYWAEALAERRGRAATRPGDLASYLLHAEIDDRRLTDDEMLDMLRCSSSPGSTRRGPSWATCSATSPSTPRTADGSSTEPELVPSAVEEVLRLYTIIFGDGRKVTRDVEFHGVQLKKGDMVYGLVPAANRDPEQFERADEFVIDRKHNHHFGFAGGRTVASVRTWPGG